MGFIRDFLARKKIDEFAQSIAVHLARWAPPSKFKSIERLSKELDAALGMARGFKRKEQLGTFGISRLANTLQWTLEEAGYDTALAREIGRSIAMRLSEKDVKARAR